MSSIGRVRESEPAQETPKGATIPVPKRDDVMRDLRKVAKPVRSAQSADTAKSDGRSDKD